MVGSNRLVLGALAVAMLGACSFLAPSDDELMGGGGADAGKGATGGKGGGTTGGASGKGGSGGLGGNAGVGGTTAQGGSPGGGGAPPGGGAAGAGGTVVSGGGGAGGSTCTPLVNQPATPRPVAVYLLLDASTSMFSSGAKWTNVAQGISSFVSDPTHSSVEVAFDHFPHGASDCPGAEWAAPDIPIAPLSINESKIEQELATLGQIASTELEGPLRGASAFGTGYAASHPDTQFSAVFLTDVTSSTAGGTCIGSAAPLAAILSAAWPSVWSYFLRANGGEESFQAPLALAGGTVSSIPVGPSATVKAALDRTLVPCQYAIPPNAQGATITYTISDPSGPATLVQVASPGACGANDGWFVSPSSTETAMLCPASCYKLAATSPPTVQVSAVCN